VELYHLAARTTGITPVGLHAYDGHIRDTQLAERTRKCDEGFAKVVALRAAIIASNSPSTDASAAPATYASVTLNIIAGGSPTFPIHAKRAKEIQCSPGTFVYWDKGYADTFPDQPFKPAALVVTRVISQRSTTRLCLDLGHKSIAPENELTRRVFFLNGPDLKAIGQSEEHLVVETTEAPKTSKTTEDHNYRIGDLLYGIPFHICPTIALYDRAHLIENGRATGTIWETTARARSLTI